MIRQVLWFVINSFPTTKLNATLSRSSKLIDSHVRFLTRCTDPALVIRRGGLQRARGPVVRAFSAGYRRANHRSAALSGGRGERRVSTVQPLSFQFHGFAT